VRTRLLTACIAAVLGATLPASAYDVAAPDARAPLGGPSITPIASYDVPLAGDGQQVIVQGTFNDAVSGPMLVDTGSSYCVLTRATARRLGLRARASMAVPVATANGEVAAGLVTLESVKIESARLGTVDAVIMDAVEPPLIGIIGLSFLRNFRYSVDHAAGRFRLER
jgi:clan AA aspartic protease (TIGR02281 family)